MRAPFAAVMAWRESRRGRRRLALYLSSVTLGVAALVAINSFSANVTASLRSQARALLGADVELRSRAAFTDSIEALLDSVARAGVPVARVTNFGSMVLAPRTGLTRLFEVRAVTGGFPFYGTITTSPPGLWGSLGDTRAVLVDPAVLVQLDALVGAGERVDLLVVGEQHREVAVGHHRLGVPQPDQPPVVVQRLLLAGPDDGLEAELLEAGQESRRRRGPGHGAGHGPGAPVGLG